MEKRNKPPENLVRSSKPLKVLNYRDQNVTDSAKTKQKISLAEYRERTKSKSPIKLDVQPARIGCQNEDMNKLKEDGQRIGQISEMAKFVNPHIRENTDVSDDDVLNVSDDDVVDVSTDIANMSIGPSDTYEKSGLLTPSGEVLMESPADSRINNFSRDKDRLKLKKSLSVAKANVETGRVTESEKPDSPVLGYSAEENVETAERVKEKGKSNFTLSLAERLKLKSVGNQSNSEVSREKVGTSKKGRTGSPDIIDLTEDEDSPVPEPVRPMEKASVRSLDTILTSKPITVDKTFGAVSKQPASSFGSLNKEPSVKVISVEKHQQQWSQAREPSKENATVRASEMFRKASDVLKDMQVSSDTSQDLKDSLMQSLQKDIARRNDLGKLFEKQKGLVSTVKMSGLPDGGARLRDNIENLERNIRELTVQIQQKTEALNRLRAEEKGPGQTATDRLSSQPGVVRHSEASKEPQIIKVYPNGTESSQPQGVASLELQKQPQVIKIYPNGAAVSQFPGSHQPHNPSGMRQTTLLPHVAQIPPHILQQMYSANPQAMQLYGGRMTADRLRQVGSVTKEAIERLHKQLETCPKPSEELEDPDGILVPLMTHQRQALMWLVWRERQSPSGGILADDMGLGKTLTMISLILKQQQLRRDGSEDEKKVWLNKDKELEKLGKSVVKSSATLIVCPASLIHHWRTEIERRCKPGLLRVCMYHGPNRERNIVKLASYDVVLTTYNIVSKEVELDDSDKKGEQPVKDYEEDTKEGGEAKPKTDLPNIMRIAWERIILDEGHNIKNHKSLQSRSVSRLRAGFRWALTGTPIQNDLLDMYSLLRFLRCSPFDEYKVWKRQVDTGSATGHNRLNVIVKTLLLRRTKTQTGASGKPLVALPAKSSTTHELELSEQERAVYDKVFAQSRSVLKEYLKRHEEKEMLKDGKIPPRDSNPFMDKSPATNTSSVGQTGSQSTVHGAVNAANLQPTGQHILVMLLRLRQCCSHLSLMKDALDDETQQNEGLELTLEEQMMDLMLNDDSQKEPSVKKTSPVFEKESLSTKMQALLNEVKAIHRPTDSTDRCKSVIVSQWTKMLDIVAVHLKKMNIRCCVIQGNIPAKKRMESVDQFNNDKHGPEVMLVSLRAGGCGLNLIGGNHLFLLDSHWNPALEDQACDRIYRVGQKKNVYIHRFLCKDTVEEKILQLQKRKQDLANNVLTGSAMSKTKLTLQDLRMLFGV